MKRHILTASVVAVCLLAVSAANASVMEWRGVDSSRVGVVTLHNPGSATDGWTVYAGAYGVAYNGVEYPAFCVDTNQDAATDEVVQWSPSQIHNGELAAWLYTNHAPSATDANHACALAVAIWEVLDETSGSFDLTSGSFRVDASNEVQTLAAGMLQDVPASYHSSGLTVLHSDRVQDMMVPMLGNVPEVPEPATFAVVIAGAVFGLLRRARRYAC